MIRTLATVPFGTVTVFSQAPSRSHISHSVVIPGKATSRAKAIRRPDFRFVAGMEAKASRLLRALPVGRPRKRQNDANKK